MSAAAPAPSGGPVAAVRHTGVIARRNLMKVLGDPALLLDATVMPMIFSVVFVYGFGGAIAGDQHAYTQYFMPGIMALTISIVARTTGIALAVDASTGLLDRLRTLPISRSAALTGQIVADGTRMLVSLVVILGFALAIGFRVGTGVPAVAAAMLLLLAYGMTLSWASAVVGLSVRSLQTVETVTTLCMVPLQFGSSLFVRPETMPAWLRVVVEHNPMTFVVDAARGLLAGGPVRAPLLGALAWIAVGTLVLAPLALHRYARRS